MLPKKSSLNNELIDPRHVYVFIEESDRIMHNIQIFCTFNIKLFYSI